MSTRAPTSTTPSVEIYSGTPRMAIEKTAPQEYMKPSQANERAWRLAGIVWILLWQENMRKSGIKESVARSRYSANPEDALKKVFRFRTAVSCQVFLVLATVYFGIVAYIRYTHHDSFVFSGVVAIVAALATIWKICWDFFSANPIWPGYTPFQITKAWKKARVILAKGGVHKRVFKEFQAGEVGKRGFNHAPNQEESVSVFGSCVNAALHDLADKVNAAEAEGHPSISKEMQERYDKLYDLAVAVPEVDLLAGRSRESYYNKEESAAPKEPAAPASAE